MNLQLRAATPQDRDFAERVYFETQRWLIEKLFGWRGDDIERGKFDEFYDQHNTKIVEVDGEAAGWLTVVIEPSRLEISSIYLTSAKQNAGIGTSLLKQIFRAAEVEGKCVTISTAKISPARRLYERLGFEVVSESEFKVYMER